MFVELWFSFFFSVREKAEILVQIEQLTLVKDELTDQVKVFIHSYRRDQCAI